MAKQTITEHGISARLACEIFQVSQTCFRYQTVRDDENILIAEWLIKLVSTWRNWGFGLCFLSLRNVLGLP